MADYYVERIKKMIKIEDRIIAAEMREVTVGPKLTRAEIRKEALEDALKKLELSQRASEVTA